MSRFVSRSSLDELNKRQATPTPRKQIRYITLKQAFLEEINCKIEFTNGKYLYLNWDGYGLSFRGTYAYTLRNLFGGGPFFFVPPDQIPRLLMFLRGQNMVARIRAGNYQAMTPF